MNKVFQYVLISLLLGCAGGAFGQAPSYTEGKVSYQSSVHVYVKFASTKNISQGDTLWMKNGDLFSPALLVKDKSSTSCVCSRIGVVKVIIGDIFYSKTISPQPPEKSNIIESDSLSPSPVVAIPAADQKENIDQPRPIKSSIRGRISAASYSSVYGDDPSRHNMRYTFALQGTNINRSRFSTENYITFRHTAGEWATVEQNLNQALKVYSLSVQYRFMPNSNITLGRRINYRISSMGAIDGLQIEKGGKHFWFGAIVGSRPNFTDYSLDFKLFQVGAFIGHTFKKNNKTAETTFAFVEQQNHSATDRRFAYVQHTHSLLKNLHLFTSFEVDLYQNIDSVKSTQPQLTNLLVNLRYRITRKLNLNLGYDNRKNIIYYESYKNYIDQLIDDETRQGLRLGLNYRLSKKITWGANAAWRFQKSDINLSKNLNTYINFQQIPGLGASLSISGNYLQTTYLNSLMYGARLSKNFFKGKLNSEISFRTVNYDYANSELKIKQNIAGFDLSWYFTQKLALHLYYEGTFDTQFKDLTRINTRFIRRF